MGLVDYTVIYKKFSHDTGGGFLCHVDLFEVFRELDVALVFTTHVAEILTDEFLRVGVNVLHTVLFLDGVLTRHHTVAADEHNAAECKTETHRAVITVLETNTDSDFWVVIGSEFVCETVHSDTVAAALGLDIEVIDLKSVVVRLLNDGLVDFQIGNGRIGRCGRRHRTHN